MTFLNPLALFGLLAATIPIVLHLINLQKPTVINFSSVRFLKELQKTAIQKLKLKQLLLLLIRILIIIFIVFAFSQPTLKGSYAMFGSIPPARIVIILDDTYSMSVINSNGELMKQARNKGIEIVDQMKENDGAFILRLSEFPDATTPKLVYDKKRLREIINKTIPKFNHSTIEEACKVAAKLLAEHPNTLQEIYIITDQQLTTLKLNSEKEEKLFQDKTSFFFTPLSDKGFNNFSVDTVLIGNSIIQSNKPIQLQAKFKNYGNENSGSIISYLSVNDKRVQQQLISIPANSTSIIDFGFTPETGGSYKAKIEIENDQFEADDVYYFTINVPTQSNILYYSTIQNSIPFALSSSTDDGTKPFIFQKSSSILDERQLANSDILFINADNNSINEQYSKIDNYLNQGKGVVIFPSEKNDNIFNSLLSALQIKSSQSVQLSTPAKITSFDESHPIINGMFENEQNNKLNNIDSPEFEYFIPLPSQTNLYPIIQLSTGTPFLAEVKNKNGKLLIFTAPFEEPFSDFNLKSLFVPLLIQTSLYAASSTFSQPVSLIAGESSTILIPQKDEINLRDILISTNNGVKFNLNANSRRNNNGIVSDISKEMISLPGFYSIENKNVLLTYICANINKLESDGNVADKNVVNELLIRLGANENNISIVQSNINIASLISEERNGRELWRECILFALMFLVIETLVSRKKKDNEKTN
ncbi:MAG: hypothetical protein EXR24_02510 [Ignavibacteria bacterium]|nr:hypothetical protein [Bacteroidota bacterium]MSQ45842.1 hypothetical protein [Ignavibacteria bacterium]